MNIDDVPNKKTSGGRIVHTRTDVNGDLWIEVDDETLFLPHNDWVEMNQEQLVDWVDTQLDNIMMDKLKERLAGDMDFEGEAVGGTDKKDLFWHAANQRSRLDPDGYEMRTINDTGKAL